MNTYRLIPACRGTLHKIRRVFRNKRLRELFAATTVTPPNNSASHPARSVAAYPSLPPIHVSFTRLDVTVC
jgi:hypothetical protein